MTPFAVALPGRIRFGRGTAAEAPGALAALGGRGVVVHGAGGARAAPQEPTLAMLSGALDRGRPFRPDWVAAVGGGAALDLGKALAALLTATGDPTDHLEVVGRALPLPQPPLPFVALPTTAGTGAEATRNAVIGLPAHRRKVSLRDDRMLPRLALVDPALTDGCPRAVTLASGLDALTQVIEPFVSGRATPFTDALAGPAITTGLDALRRLMAAEDAAARDAMAWVSLCGGIALSNAGLGAVHGLAGVIGGMTGAPHGAICGVLLPHVLAANRAAAAPGSMARERLDAVHATIAAAFGTRPEAAPQALARWAADAGLPPLSALGLQPRDHDEVTEGARTASSMQANPVALDGAALARVLAAAG
jgi:alcohol dehydrogenase class IV